MPIFGWKTKREKQLDACQRELSSVKRELAAKKSTPKPLREKPKKKAATKPKKRNGVDAGTRKNFERVAEDIEHEGFDYAFVSYSHFPSVRDPVFHTKRKAFVKASESLVKYAEGPGESRYPDDGEGATVAERVDADGAEEFAFSGRPEEQYKKDKRLQALAKRYRSTAKALAAYVKKRSGKEVSLG